VSCGGVDWSYGRFCTVQLYFVRCGVLVLFENGAWDYGVMLDSMGDDYTSGDSEDSVASNETGSECGIYHLIDVI